MFEQAFKNIDDVLWKEAGCTTELDYTEQASWLLFLKYLDGLEQDRAMQAELEGRKYTWILDEAYRWETWAAPKDKAGKLDHNKAMTGDDLRDFVDRKLFPYLHGFKQKAEGPNTIEYKIGEIFGEIKNRIHSGYNLREIIDHVDELRFRSQAEKHELSYLYEAKIKNMGNAGRNGGEYYTPRPCPQDHVAGLPLVEVVELGLAGVRDQAFQQFHGLVVADACALRSSDALECYDRLQEFNVIVGSLSPGLPRLNQRRDSSLRSLTAQRHRQPSRVATEFFR